MERMDITKFTEHNTTQHNAIHGTQRTHGAQVNAWNITQRMGHNATHEIATQRTEHNKRK